MRAFYSQNCPLEQLEHTYGLRILKDLSSDPLNKKRAQMKLLEHKSLSIPEIIKILKGHPAIEYVEPNYIRGYRAEPNDPHFNQQWGLQNTGQLIENYFQGIDGANIDFLAAQKLLRPSEDEIIVAVADSGFKIDHPDLANQIWQNPNEIPGNGIDDDKNDYVDDINGYAFGKDSAQIDDETGHGTHVAGIIVAEANNGIGISGAFDQAKLLPLSLEDLDGGFTDAIMIAAIQYTIALKNSGANIVVFNYSAESGDSQAVKDAIQGLNDVGIVFCAATSNRARDVDHDLFRSYPDSFEVPNIIAVASSNNTHGLASQSSYGLTRVDLAAPGQPVYSTTITPEGYGFMSGTSQATPYVSAAVALAARNYPNDTVEQRIRRILDNVEPVAVLSDKVASGGILNFLNIVDSDKDKLPDWWEQEHFSNLNPIRQGDLDKDGFSNEEEYLLGTDPKSADSNRKFETINLGTGNNLFLSFPTLTGRTYQVQVNDSLNPSTWENLGNPIIGDGSTKTFQEALNTTANPNRFYRLHVGWQ
ncbi:MAG: S8 family serine peptidase [Verrucomicrobia bacterium]|nr:S8 family serine peptidase [Verrucomicrobiota bacterium]